MGVSGLFSVSFLCVPDWMLEWPTVGAQQELGGEMNELVYVGDCPCAAVTDSMWQR